MRVMRALRIAALLALALAVLLGALVWRGSEQLLHPPEVELSVQGDPRSAFGFAFEEVEFPAAGGERLRGWLVRGSPLAAGGVVTVHGGGGDRRQLLPLLPLLHEAGYPVLLFDCRGRGESDGVGRGSGLGFRELHDVSSAAAFMKRTLGIKRVAAVGVDTGAAASILAAAGDPNLDVVVAESSWTRLIDLLRSRSERKLPIPTFFLQDIRDLAVLRAGGAGEPEPIDVVGRIAPRALLLVHGSADSAVPYAQSELLFERAGEPRKLWVVDGAEHGRAFEHDPEGYRKQVLSFLVTWLGPVPRNPEAPQPPAMNASP